MARTWFALRALRTPKQPRKEEEDGADETTRNRLADYKRASEWTDFELTLRIVRELGAQPLLLSMPVHARDLETVGVSRKARVGYPERLRLVAADYGALVVYFGAHEEDPLFFADHLDHLSPRGWTYYNETLDDFFHGRDLDL